MEDIRQITIRDVLQPELQAAAGEFRNDGGNPKVLKMAVQGALDEGKPVVLEVDQTTNEVRQLLIDGKSF